jgi:hypothetical protein
MLKMVEIFSDRLLTLKMAERAPLYDGNIPP